MKKIFAIGLGIGIAMFGYGIANAGTYDSASDATCDATADIVAPIAIEHTTHLRFGEVVATAVAGTVKMTPLSVRSSTAGVYLGHDSGGAASFSVTGYANSAFNITLPSDVEIAKGLDVMHVTDWESDPASPSALVSGSKTVTVGATLNVDADQVVGSYSGTFTVAVAYE